MSQHYTRNTISQQVWCNKCKAFTDHKVSGGRLAHCLPCAEKQEREHQENLELKKQQLAMEFA
jgi:ribosomal protein L44E